MAKKVQVDGLAATIEDTLKVYTKEVTKEFDAAAKKRIIEMVEDTKRQRYKHDTGKYRRAIAWMEAPDYKPSHPVYMWYVKRPHFRLSHLLERGHRMGGVFSGKGGRTVAYRFIERAEARAVGDFKNDVERILKK